MDTQIEEQFKTIEDYLGNKKRHSLSLQKIQYRLYPFNNDSAVGSTVSSGCGFMNHRITNN